MLSFKYGMDMDALLYFWIGHIHCSHTLGKYGCYIPIEDNKTNVDRTFVFPLG